MQDDEDFGDFSTAPSSVLAPLPVSVPAPVPPGTEMAAALANFTFDGTPITRRSIPAPAPPPRPAAVALNPVPVVHASPPTIPADDDFGFHDFSPMASVPAAAAPTTTTVSDTSVPPPLPATSASTMTVPVVTPVLSGTDAMDALISQNFMASARVLTNKVGSLVETSAAVSIRQQAARTTPAKATVAPAASRAIPADLDHMIGQMVGATTLSTADDDDDFADFASATPTAPASVGPIGVAVATVVSGEFVPVPPLVVQPSSAALPDEDEDFADFSSAPPLPATASPALAFVPPPPVSIPTAAERATAMMDALAEIGSLSSVTTPKRTPPALINVDSDSDDANNDDFGDFSALPAASDTGHLITTSTTATITTTTTVGALTTTPAAPVADDWDLIAPPPAAQPMFQSVRVPTPPPVSAAIEDEDFGDFATTALAADGLEPSVTPPAPAEPEVVDPFAGFGSVVSSLASSSHLDLASLATKLASATAVPTPVTSNAPVKPVLVAVPAPPVAVVPRRADLSLLDSMFGATDDASTTVGAPPLVLAPLPATSALPKPSLATSRAAVIEHQPVAYATGTVDAATAARTLRQLVLQERYEAAVSCWAVFQSELNPASSPAAGLVWAPEWLQAPTPLDALTYADLVKLVTVLAPEQRNRFLQLYPSALTSPCPVDADVSEDRWLVLLSGLVNNSSSLDGSSAPLEPHAFDANAMDLWLRAQATMMHRVRATVRTFTGLIPLPSEYQALITAWSDALAHMLTSLHTCSVVLPKVWPLWDRVPHDAAATNAAAMAVIEWCRGAFDLSRHLTVCGFQVRCMHRHQVCMRCVWARCRPRGIACIVLSDTPRLPVD